MDRISFSLEENQKRIEETLADISNLVVRRFYCMQEGGGRRAMLIVYLDGMTDSELIDNNLLRPLMDPLCVISTHNEGFLRRVLEERLSISNIKKGEDLQSLTDAVLSANCVILADGCADFYILDLKKFPQRSVGEPESDMVLRGPREGFTENMQVNIALLRRRLKSASCKFEVQKIGRYSQTDVCICYVEGIVKQGIVKELKARLERIDIDGILDSGYIEQLIADAPLSLFPTIGNAEKPDIITAKLLEGKVAVIVDGSPVVLFMPKLFPESFQVSEDYYSSFYFYSFIRVLRWLAATMAVLVPGFYIAITTYHQELLPANLITIMVASEANTPFSSGFSMLMMILIFEILREVGVRLPSAMGQTIGIVGALIMGDAAINAHIISAPILIIMAFTIICSYVSPSLNNVIAILRFVFIFAGWTFGCFGMLVVAFLLVYYMTSIRSFGVPYLSPIAPLERTALGDIFIRKPLWQMLFRPKLLSRNRQRMARGLKPHPTSSQEEEE